MHEVILDMNLAILTKKNVVIAERFELQKLNRLFTVSDALLIEGQTLQNYSKCIGEVVPNLINNYSTSAPRMGEDISPNKWEWNNCFIIKLPRNIVKFCWICFARNDGKQWQLTKYADNDIMAFPAIVGMTLYTCIVL